MSRREDHMVEAIRRDVDGFDAAAKRAAEILLTAEKVMVVGHIDADGITASSIANIALHRAGIESEVVFVKKIDEQVISMVNSQERGLVWLVDLGSGSFSKFNANKVVVTDHHRPDPNIIGTAPSDGHVNPHMFGMDGSTEVSGSGVTYWVAKAMNEANLDLAAIAIVGAVGDFQDNSESRLIGFNRMVLSDAVRSGKMKASTDLRLFGRETRPVHSLLQYSSDPSLLPFIRNGRSISEGGETKDEDDKMACVDFLSRLGVDLRDGEGFRCWAQLAPEEKSKVVSELCKRMLDAGKGLQAIRRVVGEVYTLASDLPGTPSSWNGGGGPKIRDDGYSWRPSVRALKDAKEFATLLNACGRHGHANIGMAVCMGDRGDALDTALLQQDNHREKLKQALQLVKENRQFGIVEDKTLRNLRYFNGKDQIEDTIVGIVAGMLLGSPTIPSDRPLLAFAESQDGTETIKVSARGTRELIRAGLDLSIAMREASEQVGGVGGGHNIAAGASIPEGKEMEFLTIINGIIARQLSSC